MSVAEFPYPASPMIPDEYQEGVSADPAIRVKTRSGLVRTRPGYSRVTDAIGFGYLCTEEEMLALRAFEKEVKVGSDAFSFVGPRGGEPMDVRLAEKIDYRPVKSRQKWHVRIKVEEV